MQKTRGGIGISLMNRIAFNPARCGGRPCIRGMRIRVKDVLDMLAGGAAPEKILQDFPDLEMEDIRACFAFSAAYLDHPVISAACSMRILVDVSQPRSRGFSPAPQDQCGPQDDRHFKQKRPVQNKV